MEQFAGGFGFHFHEWLVVSHVDYGCIVHNYVDVVCLETLDGALDDHIAIVLGQYVGLDKGSFRAECANVRSNLLGSCLIANVSDGDALDAFLCQIDGNSSSYTSRATSDDGIFTCKRKQDLPVEGAIDLVIIKKLDWKSRTARSSQGAKLYKTRD